MVQAVDLDALHAEGLDLDLVDQMKDLSVVGDDEDVKESQTDVLAPFSRSAPSTKVLSAPVLLLAEFLYICSLFVLLLVTYLFSSFFPCTVCMCFVINK